VRILWAFLQYKLS